MPKIRLNGYKISLNFILNPKKTKKTLRIIKPPEF